MLPKSPKKIYARHNRFKPNTTYQEMTIKKFDFNRGLKSISSKKLLFINKASSEDEDVYDIVLNAYILYLEGSYNFLDDFVGDEIIPDDKATRLLDIINSVQKTKYDIKDLTRIYKLNHKTKKDLHFFIKKSKNNFSLLLIDLYHMGIFGINYEHNHKGISESMEKKFKRYKNNDVELERIKNIAN